MAGAEKHCTCKAKEVAGQQAFASIWDNDLHDVFADVAKYYDRANTYATLGLLDRLRDRFIATIDVQPGQKVLDMCAGTNVISSPVLAGTVAFHAARKM